MQIVSDLINGMISVGYSSMPTEVADLLSEVDRPKTLETETGNVWKIPLTF